MEASRAGTWARRRAATPPSGASLTVASGYVPRGRFARRRAARSLAPARGSFRDGFARRAGTGLPAGSISKAEGTMRFALPEAAVRSSILARSPG
jgi:hypothetical protein